MKKARQAASATQPALPQLTYSRKPSHSDYEPMLQAARDHFKNAVGSGSPLFTTSTDGAELWKQFLKALPVEERQGHTCRACQRFVEKYGGLVTVNSAGAQRSALWGEAPGIYARAFRKARSMVVSATITGVFLSGERTWGEPITFDKKRDANWFHLSVSPPASMQYSHPLLTADQKAAERKEEYGMLQRGLAEYPIEVVNTAHSIAETDTLYRGEKVQGYLKWLRDLHHARAAVPNSRKPAVTWLAVATAPAGFCHVKSSVTATLLDDLKDGYSFEVAKSRFAEKMHPLQYRRPTAAPSVGQVKAAEKVIEGLESSGALKRRFARLADMYKLWEPRPVEAWQTIRDTGVFSHPLKASKPPQGQVSGGLITYEKFVRQVLPTAESLEILVPSTGAFYAMVDAEDRSSPVMLQWDNHVSIYTYIGGSSASQWGLMSGWRPVTAVVPAPWNWPDAKGGHNHAKGAMFVIEGAMDSRDAGNALFPENLKSDYHAIRHTIAAYSRSAKISGRYTGNVCGMMASSGNFTALHVRVKTGNVTTTYTIDRWD